MRDRVLAGPPYNDEEREAILDYCFGDVEQTIRLLEVMHPQLRLPSAIERGRFSCAAARIEHYGIPVDLPLLQELQVCRHDFREHLIEKVEREHRYGVYRKLRHGFSFSYEKFELSLVQEGLLEAWEKTDKGRPLLADKYLKQMAETYPRFLPFRELRKTLASLPSLNPPVGGDARNRTSLMAFRAKTSRCQPKTREFIMGYPAWLRSLMLAEPGHVLINIDLSSAEFGCDKVVAAGGVDQAQPRQYIVLVDLSESRSPDVLREDQHFLNNVIRNLNFGDHFVLIQIQQLGLADRPKRWEVPMPTPKDPSYPTAHDRQRLQSAQKGLVFEMPSFFQSRASAKVLHTDIFTTLAVASEIARDGRGKPTTLVLLPDMLQSAKGVEMEHLSRMPHLTGWKTKSGWAYYLN
jgi:hypothetical protein